MICSKVFAICSILVLAFSFAKCTEESLDLGSHVVAVQNTTPLLEENPSFEFLRRSTEVPSFEAPVTFERNYTFGERINGDRLLAIGSNGYNYDSPHDITLKLTYPVSGTGAVITFVYIHVEQSTNLGEGYVVYGGIGQRQIILDITAKGTYYFRYTAYIYGY